MIRGIKVIAIIDKGEIVSRCYSVSLVDNYKMLPVKELEIPEEKLSTREYLKIIGQYERIDKPNKIKDEIDAKVNEALSNGICTYRFAEIGWNLLDGKPVFAFSNCCVTKTGINYESYANVKGFDLIVSENFQSTKLHAKTSFLELMNILNENLEILYPIFSINIASLLNRILGMRGNAPALTMWLDGEPGSGKTELACTLGTFINKNTKDCTQTTKKMFLAFGKPKDMVQSLAQHQGLNFILDDVKAEKVLGQRDNSRTCIDTCIRSIEAQRIVEAFNNSQQALLEKSLNAGAIITGEYIGNRNIYKSSIARMVYLNVNDFVNDSQNSIALAKLQDNPYILTDLIVHVIEFLCTKYLDDNYWNEMIKDKNILWEKNKRNFYGVNSSRLADNLSSLQITGRILQDFSQNCGASKSLHMPNIMKQTDDILKDIMKETECLIEDRDIILLDAFQEVFREMNLQEPENILIYSDYNRYIPPDVAIEPYVLEKGSDGIFITDIDILFNINKVYKYDIWNDIWNRDLQDKKPVIICRADKLCKTLSNKLLEIAKFKKYKIDPIVTNTRLRKAGIIYGKLRKDKTFDNEFYYPSYVWNYGQIDLNSCVCLNNENDIVKSWINESMKDKDTIEVFDLDNMDIGSEEYNRIKDCEFDVGNLQRGLNFLSNVINK